MLLFVVRRLVWAVLLVAVVSLITFIIFLGLPDRTINSRQGLVTPNLQAQWHLDGHSLPTRYGLYLKHVFLHGDFGQSMRQPLSVREILKTSLPVTASLLIGGNTSSTSSNSSATCSLPFRNTWLICRLR